MAPHRGPRRTPGRPAAECDAFPQFPPGVRPPAPPRGCAQQPQGQFGIAGRGGLLRCGDQQLEPGGAPVDFHFEPLAQQEQALGVVHGQQSGGFGGRLAEQAERGQGDHEELGRGSGAGRLRHAEGTQQRFRLGRRKVRDTIRHGAGQLVQPRERQMGLDLYT
ncbi:hypothetical protein GCM10015535_59660 [Streptomyces gelaticus]|uniref:Uncharacterized protein n=1 Tax=Streptomyces gelaticus TaxID=285446 RepID=A0ABQ2W6H3_9ACTN|nr:hypothetical protein GCM10015535_59660 [Streptomyces gelaticus]